ncbi:MAG: hypothetical protein B6241_06835 [Spirochaetaceae bacterium 4572_59]|nr:MAG: hypothetical protein B6241_06835 [Spirochaetaceae bacterium 4572_59]
MFTKIEEGFRWIESYTNLEKKADQLKRFYRLDRMFMLLEFFNNPQNSYKSVHLAGSKGKGSTAVLIAAALRENGFKTGLFTSPHLLCYQERIRVNQEILDDQEYLNQINRIYRTLNDEKAPIQLPGGDDPTTFELLTLLGFLVFEDQGCDWAVIETGLGGRLDATNTVIPAVSLITPIEKEHTLWLGDTLEKIAAEKAGIIKEGVPIITASQKPAVMEVLKRAAQHKHSAFIQAEEIFKIENIFLNTEGTHGSLHSDQGEDLSISLKMIGSIQLNNAGLALLGLRQALPDVNRDVWIKGFAKAILPGRMQLLRESPLLIVDGAHTPNSLRLAMGDFLTLTVPSEENVLLFACGDDKNAAEMAAIAATSFSHILITVPGFFKKSHPQRVLKAFEEKHKNVQFIETPALALDYIRDNYSDLAVLVAGSFFLAGEIIKSYGESND